MIPLYIQKKETTPSVVLDSSNNKFEIKGISMAEDANIFYEDIINWIEEYCQNPNPKTVFDFTLDYYNSASAKQILEILYDLIEIKDAGKEVLVRWHYESDNEDMQEAGQGFAAICKVPFELIPFD